MRVSTFGRHIREGSKNVLRNGWMTFASMSAIAISMFILGFFLLLIMNLDHLAKQIEQKVEIRVFLDLSISSYEIVDLQASIEKIAGVKQVTFVSKHDGLKQLRERLGADGQQLFEGFEGENNPLNDAFTVEARDPRTVAEIAGQIEKLNEGRAVPPIFKISYGKGMVENLFKVTNILRTVGLGIVLLLLLSGLFLISNTIKITILARRKEIEIMKLVGATNGFIRWPFFIEGLILGFVGSLIPCLLLLVSYNEFLKAMQAEVGLILGNLLPLSPHLFQVSGVLILIGVTVGIWGSTISIRKHLKV